jgi:peptide/nickel transport system substrate-binding protein
MLRAILLLLALSFPLAAPAKHFRWATQGDAASMDPHAQNEGVTNQLSQMVYEQLAMYDREMRLVPWLATSWDNPSPTTWIFHLRRDVKFHDGSPFTADDVVFSFERAKETQASFRLYSNDSGVARRIDDYTVEFTTAVPNPVEASEVATIFIMSRKWCEKNAAMKPQDIRNKDEPYSARFAMGTGPFMLVAREPGVKTTWKRNPAWWGLREGKFSGNVTTVEYRQVENAATRMAALKSGELDFVLDPPVQNVATLKEDAALRVVEGNEARVIFIQMDQARDELLYSTVKGKNPFKDRRVRLALYQAIDIEAIRAQVMRGLSVPTGVLLPDPKGAGLPPAMERRPPYDVAAAKKLLAEAGYPNGFGFTLTCPNNRYINDEKICVALAAMWARIGLDVRVEALPRAQYFPKALKLDTSATMLGWGGDSPDAIFTLKPVLHSRQPTGAGTNNLGDYRNAELDALIASIEGEMDKAKRQAAIDKAMALVQDEVLMIPLHRQVIPWAMRSYVDVVHRSNNNLYVPWVTIR